MNFLSKAILSVVVGYNYFNDDHSLPVETKVTGTSTDAAGRPIIHVQAANYIEAARLRDGTTVPGDVMKTAVHVGKNEWELRVEDFREP